MRILVLHGPNLNLLGKREVEIYGSTTLEEINRSLLSEARALSVELDIRQTNSESELIGFIHSADGSFDGILINPGAFTHYSLALADALSGIGLPFVEVHLTNPWARGGIRAQNVIAPVASGRAEGFGPDSYTIGLKGLVDMLKRLAG